MKYFACAYYPEYWGIDRVREDARLMRNAGINVVRIGEFSWSHLEQRAGEYRTDWLSRSLEIFEEYGIDAVLCTPTASAPPWLVRKHPEILAVNKDGRSAWLGVRQHTCYTSPVYREYARLVIDKLCSVATNHKNILGWQIDNEIGHTIFGLCHCDACQKGFRQWLENRHGTIDALNNAWGNAFWSLFYSDWDEIRLGDLNMTLSSSHVLDTLRFHSDRKNAYLRAQAEQIRGYFPDALITTNSVSGISNRHTLYKHLDVAAVDVYPASDVFFKPAYQMDLFRGFKKDVPFWVLETGIGGQGYAGDPHNRRLRAQYWQFLARGAEMVSIFRWRTCLSGYEKDLMGILGHSGIPRARYQRLKECIAEIKSVEALLQSLPMPKATAGLIFDHENHWAFCGGHWSEWAKYEEINMWLHGLLTQAGVMTDVISSECEFADYKILVVPSLLHVSREVAEKLSTYVEEGGVLIMLGGTGMFTENATFLSTPGPAYLQELLGISIEDQLVVVHLADGTDTDAGNEPVRFSGNPEAMELKGTAFYWLADMELKGGSVLMEFENSGLKGQPAVVEKRSGRGMALYIGAAKTDDETMRRLLDYVMSQRGIAKPPKLPHGVERIERGHVTFLINHSDREVSFPWNQKAEARIGSFDDGVVTLGSYDVCLLESV